VIYASVDPGYAKDKGIAWAGWHADRSVASVGMVRSSARRIEDRIAEYVQADTALRHCTHGIYVESPRIYNEKRTKKPNDILKLGLVAGSVLGAALAIQPQPAYFYSPKAWKGSLPKHVAERRMRERILTPEEIAIIERALRELPASLHNDVWDAVGVGLHGLGRRLI